MEDKIADEQRAVTGRPNDTPIEKPRELPEALRNTTLRSRAQARKKQVSSSQASNKAVAGKRASSK